MKPLNILISGGGTGGHIFPAIAIANRIKELHPQAKFLFVGATGRMEMEKIPQAGYTIIDLPVQGLKRSLSISNLKVAINFIKSYFRAKKIVNQFKPNIAIGTGGYVSLPVLYAAQKANIPTLIWEGNGYAGLANKILSKKAKAICTGLPAMNQFFAAHKIHFTGNPIRQEIAQTIDTNQALTEFNLQANKPVVFITGGSLGARNINQGILQSLDLLHQQGIQLIWQTGKSFTQKIDAKYGYVSPFINNMAAAYSAANLVISRAGAITIAEICATKKPAILIPSPNVTDDHQTKNAQALSQLNAAILLPDNQYTNLGTTIIQTLQNTELLKTLTQNISPLAKPNSTQQIADIALQIAQ